MTSAVQLRDTFVKIVTEFRSRYPVARIPQGVDAGGRHPLEVKPKNRGGPVHDSRAAEAPPKEGA